MFSYRLLSAFVLVLSGLNAATIAMQPTVVFDGTYYLSEPDIFPVTQPLQWPPVRLGLYRQSGLCCLGRMV
jgi:hypothetical protein